MWQRKALKLNAKTVLKASYSRVLAVCFLIALLTTAYTSSTTLFNLNNANEIAVEVVETKGYDQPSDVVDQLINQFKKDNPKATTEEIAVVDYVDRTINSILPTHSASLNLMKIVNKLIAGKFNLVVLLLIVGFIIKTGYNIFIQPIMLMGEKRFFMEVRRYEKTPISRIFYLYKLRRIKHPAWIMLCKWFFQLLWDFTIIGGIIKHYEYKMIPYIVAENPEIQRKDAFALSKILMKGNKWETFLLDVSFIGWKLLAGITFGLANIFYVNPYIAATYAELYMWMRQQAHNQGQPLAACLSDIYLEPEPAMGLPTTEVYPVERYVVAPVPRTPINANRAYSITSYILLFFTFAFIGWAWEVGIHLVTDGEFINRGTMTGPWLPIYGSGGVLVLMLLRKWMDKPILTFGLIVVVCSVVEYFASWFLEMKYGIRWWDYSNYFMNLNGRICLLGASIFGLGGSAFLYYLAPRLDDLYNKIPSGIKLTICAVLCGAFGFDAVNSLEHPNTGKGITDYGYIEETGTHIADVMDQIKF
ncbi:putative membrane protein [Clostridiales Family XIII bacterium PM5-7]